MAKISVKIKSLDQFRKVLVLGAKQMVQGKNNIWEAAKFAIAHYNKCGDHGPLNEVMSTLRTMVALGAIAFQKWVEKYTDQVWDKEIGKFVRSADAVGKPTVNLEAAFSENFWNRVQMEQEAALFGSDEFYGEVLKVVKRFQNADRKKANDIAATKAVDGMFNHIRAKAPSVVLAA